MAKARIQVFLLRHADAGDPELWEGPDAERPLSPKGIRQSERLSSFLAGNGFKADAFVSSPKKRAQQTAEIVAGTLGAKVTLDDRLAEGFGVPELAAIVDELKSPDASARIVLVGHDPDFSATLSELVGADGIGLAKGALARIDIGDDTGRGITAGSGNLRWLLPPDALKRATEPA
jgi:phosphohistidine phosphatase SixA